ncbi:MAG: hypothetical protein AB1758_29725 [Candidatus Eremiobacterota bacterium]
MFENSNVFRRMAAMQVELPPAPGPEELQRERWQRLEAVAPRAETVAFSGASPSPMFDRWAALLTEE